MNLYTILASVEGTGKDLGTGAIIAIVAIILVFVILAAIIGITYGVSLLINKVPTKAEPKVAEESSNHASALDLNDEDATVAALVASIDYRNETKKNVKVVSIKEIK